MSSLQHIELENRGILSIGGPEASEFLQGLITNNILNVDRDTSIYAALLTPQGKFLHDFFIVKKDGCYLLDCEHHRLMDLGKRFAEYRLRANVELLDLRDDLYVSALIGEAKHESFGLKNTPGHTKQLRSDLLIYNDPRPKMPSLRLINNRKSEDITQDSNFCDFIFQGTFESYEKVRIASCIPDGSRDMEIEKATLMEYEFEALSGVDFEKGCYVGQEVTARTKYRGLVRRKLYTCSVDGPLPIPGTKITINNQIVGKTCTGIGNKTLALMQKEKYENSLKTKQHQLVAAGSILTAL